MPVFLLFGILIAWIWRRTGFKQVILQTCVSLVVFILFCLPLLMMMIESSRANDYYYNLLQEKMYNWTVLLKSARLTGLVFFNPDYGFDGIVTQGNVVTLPLVLGVLLFGGLLYSLSITRIWLFFYFAVCFLVSLVPTIILHDLPSSHRTMAIIPLIGLLTGYALWVIVEILKQVTARSVVYISLVIICVSGCIWGVGYFFHDMWDIEESRLEHMCLS